MLSKSKSQFLFLEFFLLLLTGPGRERSEAGRRRRLRLFALSLSLSTQSIVSFFHRLLFFVFFFPLQREPFSLFSSSHGALVVCCACLPSCAASRGLDEARGCPRKRRPFALSASSVARRSSSSPSNPLAIEFGPPLTTSPLSLSPLSPLSLSKFRRLSPAR